jgi:hypothetical protein
MGLWGWGKAAIVWMMILATAFRRTLAVSRLVRVKTLVHKACGRDSTAGLNLAAAALREGGAAAGRGTDRRMR